MVQRNQEIRKAAADAGVRLWQIAEKLGIGDITFSKRLRKEFAQDQRKHVLQIIRVLEREQKKEVAST